MVPPCQYLSHHPKSENRDTYLGLVFLIKIKAAVCFIQNIKRSTTIYDKFEEKMCTSLTWEEQRGMVWKVLVVIASRSIPGRGSIWSMQQWQPRNRARRSRVGGIRSASCERPASPSWSPRCRQAGHWWSVPRSGHFLLDSIFIAWTIIVKYIIGFFTKKQTETISYVVAKPDPFKKIFRRGLPLYCNTHILD